jgi:glycosyltransferase involved in cell wall biosynthesis
MAKGPNLYNLPPLDPSVKAAEHLSSLMDEAGEHEDIVILDEELKTRKEETPVSVEESVEEEVAPIPEARTVTAGAARVSDSVLEVVSERDSVRLLIFTKNVAMRQLGSLAQKRLLELSGIFAEIHVIILNEQAEETVPTVRLTENVWIYSTESVHWWKIGFDAYRIANEQLVFAGGFRADIVVAEDPFESAAAAHFIADKYDRPLQVHVLEDIYDEEFKDRDEHNIWRLFIARYVLHRADCIRTTSDFVRSRIVDEHPKLEQFTETLPVYYNLEAWRDMSPTINLKEKYPQFKFIILHVSSMQTKSHTPEVIQGIAPILRLYPTIGLVVVGNGPYRSALEKQVIALGIQGQVEFEPVPDEIVSHMKSSNILIHLSEDPNEDTVVLEAATVKLPMIASTASIAGTLFKNEESAFLCDGADPACVSYYTKSFLNDNQSRSRLAMNAQEAVFQRIEQDYTAYLLAYRSSIERCVA